MAQPGYWSCSCCGNLYKRDGSEEWLWDDDHPIQVDWATRLCVAIVLFAVIYFGAHLLAAMSGGALTDKEIPPCVVECEGEQEP